MVLLAVLLGFPYVAGILILVAIGAHGHWKPAAASLGLGALCAFGAPLAEAIMYPDAPHILSVEQLRTPMVGVLEYTIVGLVLANLVSFGGAAGVAAWSSTVSK